jgi:lysozyme
MWQAWIDHVKRFEGCRLSVYRCPAGIWTIGWGHTGPDVTAQSPPISVDQAEALLRADLAPAWEQAASMSPVVATDTARRAAIADFIFNCGPHRYAKSTLRKRVAARRWEAASLENAKWVYGGGVKLKGLEARRAVSSKWLKEG